MSRRIVRSSRATRDLYEVWRYIAEDDVTAADRHIIRIEDKLIFLAQWPNSGALRPHFGRDVRSFVLGRYTILYRPIADGIRVLRVMHGARKAIV
ncbi:toxin ParE1/3/4 [Sphingomonas jinjuensis]|uniref:Toxin ParE1/3/4 n=1 Tax=Sphingomonas jinjuensis TaxID=535907 RepID=A0A840FB06_9SPHN|nr:toxin ParE1/3/4 [Sphingomonas jinjuensis]